MDNDQVIAALSTVMDPELRRSVVDLGMVRDIAITDERLSVRLVLTTAGCPLKNRIRDGRPSLSIPDCYGARSAGCCRPS